MDLKGSLVDTNLRIFPSNNLLDYIKTLPINNDVPINIARLVKGKTYEAKSKHDLDEEVKIPVHLNSKDVENLNKIKAVIKIDDKAEDIVEEEPETEKEPVTAEKKEEIPITAEKTEEEGTDKDSLNKDSEKDDSMEKSMEIEEDEVEDELYLTTSDIDWLYTHLQNQKKKGTENVPYLHTLLEGSDIKTPRNQRIKRNPVLEARCVKLRAQQEAREYRKMTKSVDNVRLRFPEDTISYQMKQLNRQLIAIGQFLISIFAGFLFGFRGVEWMVGNLDFGFRLLLGVMCALVIALAEIYFLAKKLNEELNIPETTQLGGPPKFADGRHNNYEYEPKVPSKAIDKEHQD
ncbi:unnamed protein product [Chrysodeixis includens]|uniref:Transmembrane protein 199 n=1 Tax=Chrysodeixis includens TaxID=689277 RepID=A0A9P0BVI1_CHRIL|nr:unnamed protein product [Chrysodeixis includens]